MEFEEIIPTCPECGSKDVTLTFDENIECNYCEASTSVEELTQKDSTTDENPFEIEEEEEDIDEPKSMSQYRELITDFFNPESLHSVDDRAREEGFIVLTMRTGETLVL